MDACSLLLACRLRGPRVSWGGQVRHLQEETYLSIFNRSESSRATVEVIACRFSVITYIKIIDCPKILLDEEMKGSFLIINSSMVRIALKISINAPPSFYTSSSSTSSASKSLSSNLPKTSCNAETDSDKLPIVAVSLVEWPSAS
jgi:hypothetical protein